MLAHTGKKQGKSGNIILGGEDVDHSLFGCDTM
jgi:hypothetical protein